MAALRETPQQQPRPSWMAPFRAAAALPGATRRGTAAFGHAGLVAASAAALALAALALTLVLNAGAPTASASTLTVFAGNIEQFVDGSWRPLADGAELHEGARLRTDGEGSALLTFADGSTAGIEPDTELRIDLARVDGARRIRLHQSAGRLWNDVAPDERPDALYVVETPDAVVTARGTLFETLVEAGETAVSTADGLVELRAGEQRVFVAPGETTVARRRQEIAPVQRRDLSQQAPVVVAVNAPFAASLVAPDGKATGMRPDGVAFHQIAGAASSRPGEGPQRIELRRPTPGTYRLLLRRVGEGEGEVVLTLGPDELRFPVQRAGEAVQLELRVSVEDGRLRVRPLNVRAVEARETEQHERVVVTERAQGRAVPVTAQPAAPPDGEGAEPPADERPDDDDGRDERGRGQGRGLEQEARGRLRERLGDAAPGRLRQSLDDDTREQLRERLADRDARSCDDLQPSSAGAAACSRIVAAATERCAGDAGRGSPDACEQAIDAAGEACKELPGAARRACKAALDALEDDDDDDDERDGADDRD